MIPGSTIHGSGTSGMTRGTTADGTLRGTVPGTAPGTEDGTAAGMADGPPRGGRTATTIVIMIPGTIRGTAADGGEMTATVTAAPEWADAETGWEP